MIRRKKTRSQRKVSSISSMSEGTAKSMVEAICQGLGQSRRDSSSAGMIERYVLDFIRQKFTVGMLKHAQMPSSKALQETLRLIEKSSVESHRVNESEAENPGELIDGKTRSAS